MPFKDKNKISTPLNMVWPGAPYPHGAVLYFDCYGDDANKLKNDDPLYCYTTKEGGGDTFVVFPDFAPHTL